MSKQQQLTDLFCKSVGETFKNLFISVELTHQISQNDYAHVKTIALTLISKKFGSYPQIFKILRKSLNKYKYYEKHTLISLLLSLAMFEKLDSVTPESELSLVLAVMVHDLTMLTMSYSSEDKNELTSAEFFELLSHPLHYDELFKEIDAKEYLLFRPILETHHEQINGQGYPHKLRGNEIPVEGKILAIVSAYSALREERPYRKAFTHSEAEEIMRGDRGKFDEELLELLFQLAPSFEL